jgi:hypothetical protein
LTPPGPSGNLLRRHLFEMMMRYLQEKRMAPAPQALQP